MRATRLRKLFDRAPRRVGALTLEWNDWRVDICKERIDSDTLQTAADAVELPHWVAALFAGEPRALVAST